MHPNRLLASPSLITMLITLLSATSQGQSQNNYFFSVGPAVTSGSEWGTGHKTGFSAEGGLIRQLSASWGLVVAGGFERFDVAEPDYIPVPVVEGSRWGSVRGGDDFVGSIRGGLRYRIGSTQTIQPYVGAALGLSLARQDEASASITEEFTGRVIDVQLQGANTQFGLGFSPVLGIRAMSGPSRKMFIEVGYTFVFTPDDSFDDNPAFFPIRVGIVF